MRGSEKLHHRQTTICSWAVVVTQKSMQHAAYMHCIDIARHILTVLSFSMRGIIIELISFRMPTTLVKESVAVNEAV